MQDRPALGGAPIRLRCPNCSYELTLADGAAREEDPVRCGACGSEIPMSQLHRILEETIAGRAQA